MKNFESLLKGSVMEHGHLCPGQVVGVRMAMLGCRLLGFDTPCTRDQLKKLLVFIEMDRCAADAVSHVTGVKLGRRSLKFMDYGIMAATFLNLDTEDAYRIISTEESRGLAPRYAPEVRDTYAQQLKAYKIMPDSALFRIQEVEVKLSVFDLPGPTRRKVACSQCGQVVRDGREVVREGRTLCRPCAEGAYFRNSRDISAQSMDDWTLSPPLKRQDEMAVRREQFISL